VLLFSFSRPTLAYLYERLSPTMRVAVMHGGIHKDERTELIARFRRGEFDVLLASRVASEGLDFEFCSAVVNYDLPWNPMEVEQRIGRIDRFGQTEDKVLILNFHTPGHDRDRHRRSGAHPHRRVHRLDRRTRTDPASQCRRAPQDHVRLPAHIGAA
jgi:superfamily II DNA/RNA helicase